MGSLHGYVPCVGTRNQVRIGARLLSAGLGVWLSLAGTMAQAQLFGARSLGTTLSRQSGQMAVPTATGMAANPATTAAPGAPPPLATVRGNERYIRGNRQVGDVVGANESGSVFVGVQQGLASGPVRSAIAAAAAPVLRVNRLPQAPASTNRPYDPRVRVDFEVPQRLPDDVAVEIINRLESVAQRTGMQGNWQVEFQQGTATLRGVVASHRDRILAEQVVRLEPGIARVRNELLVESPQAP